MGKRTTARNFLGITPGIIALCIGVVPFKALGDESTDAVKAVMKATYYQSGLRKNTKRLKKVYVDSRIDKDWQNLAMNVFMVMQMIEKQQLVLKWTF